MPVNFDYETIETTRDTSDFVARLHRCMLTKYSEYLTTTGLAELLSIGAIELSSDEIEDFGDECAIVYRLDQERASQFVAWKQGVIDMLKLFVSDDETFLRPDETVYLGTPVFQNLWEDACQTAFGNQLDERLDNLGIELTESWRAHASERLIDIIPGPKWTKVTDKGDVACGDCLSLIPDVIALHDAARGQGLLHL